MDAPEPEVANEKPTGLIGRWRKFGDQSLQMRRIRANLAAIVGINVLALVTGPVLARALGPAGRGELAAAVLWPQLVSLALSLGVSDAITFFSSRAEHTPRAVLRTATRLAGAQTLGIWVLGAPVVYLTMHHFGSSAMKSSLIYLAAMPANLYAIYLISLLNGLHRYGWYNALFLALFVITAVIYVVLFAAGELTVRTAVIANVISVLVTLTLSLAVARRSVEPASGRLDRREPGLERSLLSFGTRSWASTVPHQLNDRVDQLVISLVLPAHDLGLYAVAATIATAPGFVGIAVATSVLPTVAATSSIPEQVRAARQSVLLTLGLTLTASLVVVLLIHPVISIVFGQAFLGGAPSARVLSLSAVMLSVTRVFHGLLKGLGRPFAAAISEGAALLVTALGLAILVPAMGIMGAAITSAGAYTTSTLVAARYASSALGIPMLGLIWSGATTSMESG